MVVEACLEKTRNATNYISSATAGFPQFLCLPSGASFERLGSQHDVPTHATSFEGMEMAESEKRKRLWFIGGLVITAFAINGAVFVALQKVSTLFATRAEPARQVFSTESDSAATARRNAEERKAEEERKLAEERKAAKEAAAAHARFLERNLNTGFGRTHGLKTVAVVVSCDGRIHHALDATLVDRFNQKSLQVLPSFFTSEFVSDGLFEQAFTGSKELFTKLELTNYVDALVLAREKVEYSTNPSLENVLTASATLEVACLSVPANALAQTWTFISNGAGFKETEARAMAEERLANQILKDTKMSLPP
jgi:hypothetical protein